MIADINRGNKQWLIVNSNKGSRYWMIVVRNRGNKQYQRAIETIDNKTQQTHYLIVKINMDYREQQMIVYISGLNNYRNYQIVKNNRHNL